MVAVRWYLRYGCLPRRGGAVAERGVQVDHVTVYRCPPRWAEGAENLCDLLIFVQQSAGAVNSTDAERIEVDYVIRQLSQRRGLIQGVMRLVAVVERLVLMEQASQVCDVPDQGPVGQFGTQATKPRIHDCVVPRRSRSSAD